jgi:hypothetical protein
VAEARGVTRLLGRTVGAVMGDVRTSFAMVAESAMQSTGAAGGTMRDSTARQPVATAAHRGCDEAALEGVGHLPHRRFQPGPIRHAAHSFIATSTGLVRVPGRLRSSEDASLPLSTSW